MCLLLKRTIFGGAYTKRTLKIVKQIRKTITKFGLSKEDIGFTTN